MLLVNATGRVGYRDLEDGLCEIHCNLGSVHRAPPSRVAFGAVDLFWHAGAGVGEESIPSIDADAEEGERYARVWSGHLQPVSGRS